MALTVMLKIVSAALKAKTSTFEAILLEAIKFGLESKAWPPLRGLHN